MSIDGYSACVSARGVERTISLLMMPEGEVTVGDFVIVHLGQATQKIGEEEARRAWELLEQILAQVQQ